MTMTNFLQPELYFVVKSLSICPGIYRMLEFGEHQSLYSYWRYKEHPKV